MVDIILCLMVGVSTLTPAAAEIMAGRVLHGERAGVVCKLECEAYFHPSDLILKSQSEAGHRQGLQPGTAAHSYIEALHRILHVGQCLLRPGMLHRPLPNPTLSDAGTLYQEGWIFMPLHPCAESLRPGSIRYILQALWENLGNKAGRANNSLQEGYWVSHWWWTARGHQVLSS